MPRIVVAPEKAAAAPTTQVVEEKKTTTTQIPGLPEEVLRPGVPGRRPTKPPINEWFASIPPDERANAYSYTLYRDDSRIIIVDENLDDRASGTMLYKLTPDDVRALPEGPFLQELGDWVKKKGFGGGEYHIMITLRKGSKLQYNKGFKLAGVPIPSDREAWISGQQPGAAGTGGDVSILPMLMKLIDEKLEGIKEQRQDPGTALAEVTKAIMDANTTAYKWAIENAPKPIDPTKQLENMKLMLEIFKSMQPAPVAAAAAPDMATQLTQISTVIEAVRKIDTPKESAQSMKDMIVEGIKTALREGGFRGGGNRAGTDWSGLLEKAIPFLGPLAVAVLSRLRVPAAAPQPQTLIQRSPIGSQYQPAQGGAGPMGPGMGVGVPPGAPVSRGWGQPMPPQPPQPPPVVPEPTQPAATPDQIVITEEVQSAVLWSQATRRIVDMLTHDKPGDEAAESLDNMFPDIAVHMVNMNEQSLMALVSSDAELAKIKDDPRLPKFIQDFLDYFKPEVASSG
jgi:hypothetical protein